MFNQIRDQKTLGIAHGSHWHDFLLDRCRLPWKIHLIPLNVCVCVRACAHVRVEERGQCLFDFWAVWPQQQATHIHTHELYVLNFLSSTDGTGLSFTLMYILAAFPKTVMQHFRLIEIQHVKVNQLIQLSTQLFKRAFTYLDVRFRSKSNDYYYFLIIIIIVLFAVAQFAKPNRLSLVYFPYFAISFFNYSSHAHLHFWMLCLW